MYYGEGGTTAFKRSSNGLWANDDTEPGLHRKKNYIMLDYGLTLLMLIKVCYPQHYPQIQGLQNRLQVIDYPRRLC